MQEEVVTQVEFLGSNISEVTASARYEQTKTTMNKDPFGQIFQRLFPTTSADEIETSVRYLQSNEFEFVEDLRTLEPSEWESLTLPLAINFALNPPPQIVDIASLQALEREATAQVVTSIRSAPSKTSSAPMMSAQKTQLFLSSPSSVSATGAKKRILREYQDFINDPPEGWNVFVGAENIQGWKAILSGLPYPYDGGAWVVTIDFPSDYPFKPPRVRFVTRFYHCNISTDGGICLDILKDQWSPALTISKALLSISALTRDPNPDDPLDACKAQLYRDNRSRYEQEAQEWTRKYASATVDEIISAGSFV